MAKGAPDYTQPVEIRGFDGTTLKTLKVDTDGQLYAILRGIYGTTFKNVAVDDKGQLYVILRGASGNDVAVDANGFISAVLKGVDAGGNFKTIRTNDSGYIVALLSALYGTSEKALVADENGNLKLNISAQELTFLVARDYVGTLHSYQETVSFDPATEQTIINVSSGKGFLLKCHVRGNNDGDILRIVIDGNTINDLCLNDLNNHRCIDSDDCVVVGDGGYYHQWITKELIYESSMAIKFYSGGGGEIRFNITYTIV